MDEEIKDGYQHVYTPDIAKLDLYKKSGHYPYYKDSMYAPIQIEDEEFMLRPMTCPHHFELYLSRPHSYKELPIRYAELAKLYRFEQSGELMGLQRVRSFCLADAHIIAKKDQAEFEINRVLDLIEKVRPDVLAGQQEKKELLEKLVEVGGELKDAVIPQLPLELLVVDWCGSEKLPEVKIQKKQGRVSFEEVQAKWQELLAKLKPKNHSLAGLLRSSKPIGVEGSRLTIEVFYQFHLDQLKQEKYRLMVEEGLGEVFAFPLKLQYILGSRSSQRHLGGGPLVPSAVEGDTSEVVKAAEEVFGDVR